MKTYKVYCVSDMSDHDEKFDSFEKAIEFAKNLEYQCDIYEKDGKDEKLVAMVFWEIGEISFF